MSELKFSLLKGDVPKGSFDCENKEINKWVEDSYYATLLQQAYAYQIRVGDVVVGYYMIAIRNVDLYDCPDEVSDYFQDGFGDKIPSVYIEYLAIDKKFKGQRLGETTLRTIIKRVRDLSEQWPIRLITINALTELVEWYKREGFLEMAKSLPGQEGYNVYMYLDCIKNMDELDDYTSKEMEEMS